MIELKNNMKTTENLFDLYDFIVVDCCSLSYSEPRKSIDEIAGKVAALDDVDGNKEFIEKACAYSNFIDKTLRIHENFWVADDILQEYRPYIDTLAKTYECMKRNPKFQRNRHKKSYASAVHCFEMLREIKRNAISTYNTISGRVHTSIPNFNNELFSGVLEWSIKAGEMCSKFKPSRRGLHADEKTAALAYYAIMFLDKNPLVMSGDSGISEILETMSWSLCLDRFSSYINHYASPLAKALSREVSFLFTNGYKYDFYTIEGIPPLNCRRADKSIPHAMENVWIKEFNDIFASIINRALRSGYKAASEVVNACINMKHLAI